MSWTESAIRKDIADYLRGRLTTNELIRRNDEAVEALTVLVAENPDSEQGAWTLATDLEALLSERVYRHISEDELRGALRGMVPMTPRRAIASVGRSSST